MYSFLVPAPLLHSRYIPLGNSQLLPMTTVILKGIDMGCIQVRINKKGIRRYTASIRKRGCHAVFATFHRKSDAQSWISQEESKIQQGVRRSYSPRSGIPSIRRFASVSTCSFVS
jgi:hypothetical protein